MSTTSTGGHAESVAAEYLTAHGFVILERNFRTPRCEIDIVAKKGKCVYFVEVKYRSHAAQGSGLEYVTPKKQKQMHYAAEVWMAERDWPGEAVLSAIEVDRNFTVTEFIESIV